MIGATIARPVLQFNNAFMQSVCVPGFIYSIGILCASLAGGLSSLIGASRVLQALARDRLLPLGVFATGTFPPRESGCEWKSVGCLPWVGSSNDCLAIAYYQSLLTPPVSLECIGPCW